MVKSDLKEFSLYIHIPFCRRRCDYCAFHSSVMDTGNDERASAVINDIIKEIDSIPNRFPLVRIPSVYMGGGTPSCLPSPLLKRLLETVRLTLDRTGYAECEWTIEANPADVDRNFLSLLDRYGVNRISVGIQDFKAALRDTLGRREGDTAIRQALDSVGLYWKGKTSVDLIHSIPGQDNNDIALDMAETAVRRLTHVSWYGLSIEEGTPLSVRGMNEESHPEHQEQIDAGLAAIGLERYEISNYAVPGFESLHNLRYWRMEPWLGIGPGAVSMMPGTEGLPIRFTGSRKGIETITPLDLYKEYFMMGLRTREGVNLQRMEEVFGMNILAPVSPCLDKYADLFIRNKNHLQLTRRGLDISNSILSDLFLCSERNPFPTRNIVWPIFSLD